MADTIASGDFTTFAAGTEIQSAPMNTNFSAFRGNIIPVNDDTSSASDITHSLGNPSHRWAQAYCNPWPAFSTQTGTYTALSTDGIIFANASTAAFTITLPSATSVTGQVVTIFKEGTDVNTLTVDAAGSETIDSTLSVNLVGAKDYVNLHSNGVSWQRLNDQTPNKFQEKILSANVTTNTTISDFTYANLKVGKFYRVSGQLYLSDNGANVATFRVDVAMYNSDTSTGAQVGEAKWNYSESTEIVDNLHIIVYPNFIFQAVDSNLIFNTEAITLAMVNGNGLKNGGSFVQLEELNNYKETTEF